ncbi:zinc finger MYM-type protein 1-like [Myzus persicae]|uniref:zinc finger MYM-type protein 1-like n=1 Tax=Myzus persicae TaxID=13164 RepID=UPI000B939775|nr:zinc finger MYM-type protein 1-like [Myzus persicae]
MMFGPEIDSSAFVKSGVGYNSKKPNSFVVTKFDNWRKALEGFQTIVKQIITKPVYPILDIFLKQNTAIRGHRDSGKLMIDQTDDEYENNEGNFREILRVNSAQCFSILADETADIANIEQEALCLVSLILESLHNFGIETKYMRGQGYDGAAAMSGEFNGVQAIIRKTHPLALYVHCSAHVLNLAVSNSCKVQEIRNLNDFEELFEQVIESLNFISEWKDVETSSHASNLCSAILEGGFIISMLIVAKCFSVGLPLSKHLQRVNIDLGEAIQLAEDTIKELEDFRKNADSIFQDIFENAVSLGNKFGVTISIPRTTKRQANRVNVETDSIEVYYRIAILIPYIETFIEQLKVRFASHKAILVHFNSLISLNTDENNFCH